ncbi:hypothetical protein [Planktotalea sp.]|uniref:hypothetical protein n=1 Tax=Planktotalea sp. TaxID=2029877 RepID=UPI003297EACB
MNSHSYKFFLPATLAMSTMLMGCISNPSVTGTTSSSGGTPAATSGGGTTSGGSTSGGTSGGTGGGTGGGGSLSAYETAFNAANGQLPTQTAITGNATYSGQVNVLTGANAADQNESVTGDLAMTIDFTPNVARPISSTVNNIAGEVNGVQTNIAGTLSTANAPNGVNAISTTNLNIAGQPTTFTGLSTELRGTLTDPTDTLSGNTIMTMQGDFKGADGASVTGSTGVSITPANNPTIITGGTFYADKD